MAPAPKLVDVVTSPADPLLDRLCVRLAELSPALQAPGAWPSEQLRLCGEAGVHEWFVGREHGGQGWREGDLLRGYVKLAAACLTTAFILTQRTGAMTRIAAGESDFARGQLLFDLIHGHTFATVGISHLTTSRQHLTPVMRAAEEEDGFVLDGYSPWVTGAEYAQHVVLGATLADGRQILIALPTDLPGVRIPPAPELVGLSASRTGPLECENVRVERRWLLAGPVLEVMKQGLGAKTGGLQTSALAIGLSSAAIDFMRQQAAARGDLAEAAEALSGERDQLLTGMLALSADDHCTASGRTAPPATGNDLRQRANSLVLRASQAALAAAKGAGFLAGHPAGRWCREALFFLVWSCPQPVLAANLCELAGLTD